jgi:phosphomannomutase
MKQMPENKQHHEKHLPNPVIFRAYDIRGVFGETLQADDAFFIARAFASYVIDKTGNPAPSIALGRDGRLSSPVLHKNFTEGLLSCGAHMVDVGIGPTPMLYFAVKHLELDGGVMITGSHNPKDHNGFKMMLARETLFGAEIQKLRAILERGVFSTGKGRRKEKSVQDDYIQALLGAVKPAGRPLKVAWDPGNGAAGEVMAALVRRMPGDHVLFNDIIDGQFPSHHPDPSEEENLHALVEVVKEEKCDLGVAFDGDADRVGIVDEKGKVLWNDQLMVLLARDVLAGHKGATIIADVKASKMLFDEIRQAGGKPMVWKTGHSLIKAKMAEEKALLAGEMSGHIFFADCYYGFDDGIYAALRLINYLAQQPRRLSEIIGALPKFHSTPEIRLACPDAKKFSIVESIKQSMVKQGAKISDIDGVRVDTEDGWWLVRASNTQAALSMRAEGRDEKALRRVKGQLVKELEQCGLTCDF